jgi:hypothetical protein
VSFTTVAGPRQRSGLSYVGLYFTCLIFETPPGSHIYTPQEQGGPVIPPSTGFPFHRLLRLARLRREYSNPPLHRHDSLNIVYFEHLHDTSRRTEGRTLSVTPKRQRKQPLLGNKFTHATPIARKRPIYYCECVSKPHF